MFFALTEFRGANSVSSFRPIICVSKRTHRVFHRTCPQMVSLAQISVRSLFRNSTLETVFRPFPDFLRDLSQVTNPPACCRSLSGPSGFECPQECPRKWGVSERVSGGVSLGRSGVLDTPGTLSGHFLDTPEPGLDTLPDTPSDTPPFRGHSRGHSGPGDFRICTWWTFRLFFFCSREGKGSLRHQEGGVGLY